MMTLPPVVIVPDVGDSARDWQRFANLSAHFTPDVVAIEPLGDSLAADAERVRAAIEAAVEPPIVMAHGYGALAATVAANRRNTSLLIFVAGYMLDYGETIYDVVGGPSTSLTTTRVDTVGWRAIPTTYVVCRNDRRIARTVQEQLANHRATTIVELDAGEQPFRSHSEALAQILHEELVAVRGGQLHAALRVVKTA